jgi:DNA-binding IclR family transcriptional regulator
LSSGLLTCCGRLSWTLGLPEYFRFAVTDAGARHLLRLRGACTLGVTCPLVYNYTITDREVAPVGDFRQEAHVTGSTSAPRSPGVGALIAIPDPDSATKPHLWSGPVPPDTAGRGVLDGAFAVLDALAYADEGLGLTELARTSGLAKTSAHRLAEQLVTLGAVQYIEHRYYVGPRLQRIGQRWQPDPLLRRCAQAPIHTLAVQSRAMASLRILHEHRLRYICATAPHGHAYIPDPTDPESIARTATGRVLYATQPAGEVTLHDCWTRREWRDLRDSIRDPGATVVDHQDAVAGMCCVSAPVWWPNGTCAGAVTVTVHAIDLPAGLPTLVSHIARRIGAALQQLNPK